MKLSNETMKLSWQFIKKDGLPKNEAMRLAWMNVKLVEEMKKRIVQFYFKKMDGSEREACGTLQQGVIPATANAGRKNNETLLTYFDVNSGAFRSFRKVNLLRIE